MSKSFIDLTEATKGTFAIRNPAEGSVIKSARIKDEQPARAINRKLHPKKVTPIKKDDLIIGIQVTCSCGEVTEVYFQYEQQL